MSEARCPACSAANPEFNARCRACGAVLSGLGPLLHDASLAPATGPTEESAGRFPGAEAWIDRVVGTYRVTERLGAGAMGTVYRAESLAGGRAVALKTLPDRTSRPRPGLLERIRREVQALSRLRHPGIVRVLEHGVEDGMPWYAMELVQGPTLRAWAGAGHGLEQRLTLTRGLCSALAYLHGEGLLHRDLKPDNVLIRAASTASPER